MNRDAEGSRSRSAHRDVAAAGASALSSCAASAHDGACGDAAGHAIDAAGAARQA